MHDFKQIWQDQGIWQEIEEKKPIFMESAIKDQFQVPIRQYYDSINQMKGAILMAVLRGKVSEGLDFADMYGRCVVIGNFMSNNINSSA